MVHSMSSIIFLMFLPNVYPRAIQNDVTDWSTISPLLTGPTFSSQLPPLPTKNEASNYYGANYDFSNGAPFAKYQMSDFPDTALLCENSASTDVVSNNFSAIRGGPYEVCDSQYCSGPVQIGEEYCRTILNGDSIMLTGKIGTYWAKAIGAPSWLQFTFPKVPEGSSELHFSFTLDNRYRPELYGGNPCDNASDQYECKLCIADLWDHDVPPGVFVLWTGAGRNSYVIDGPIDHLMNAFDSGDLVQNLEPPAALNLQAGEYPVVTFFTFSQYPAYGEISNSNSCSINQSDESGHTYKDKPLMISKVSMMYRSDLTISKQPPISRPRLYGTDSEWMSDHVIPFFDAPCDPATHSNAGWFDGYGYISLKSNFDLAARGFISCNGDVEPAQIEWNSLSGYFNSEQMPNQTGGFRAFHLLRRLWACGNSNQGDFSSCEYSYSETNRLAAAVALKEMERFSATQWSCGAICGGNGNPAFDLTTSEQVSFFVHFYDVLSSQTGLLSAGDAQSIENTLEQQMLLFVDNFWTSRWQLWNGNNWTPHLCVAALEWATVFWHEKNDLAHEVLRIVNDIMWLHRNYYTSDGVYVEGVMMYSIMSIEGQMAMASICRAGWGFAPEAIAVEVLQKTASFMIASMSSDGYTIDFGDSHRKRGWSNQLALIEAAMAPISVKGEQTISASLTAKQIRAFSAALYGSGGVYSNPWRVRGHVLKLDLVSGLRVTPQNIAKPLGVSSIDLFQEGGYARMLAPLLNEASANESICFQSLCIDPSLPSLSENIPYSSMFLQARKNIYAHSEVDFGSIIWSAWGSRLLSDFGYGTISTSVNQWDMRRYNKLDNNPAGHNTVVIREAFQPGSDKINFSQLNFISGTMSNETFGGYTCILMDGSLPYGSARPDGWLNIMKRYVCEYSNGNNILLDIVQVKPNRTALSLYGAQYGGPNFNEPSPANQRLTIDEYFYIDTEAPIQVTNDVPAELPFNRSQRCMHIDAALLLNNTSILLKPLCGIGSWRDADGNGKISGFSSASNGAFVYDGLITSENRWGTPHTLKRRRFRFETTNTVGPEGDVRTFFLSPYATDMNPIDTTLGDCGTELGCGNKDNVICSCVHICENGTFSWIIVLNGNLSLIETVGTCENKSGLINLDMDTVINIRTQLGFQTSTASPTATPTATPAPTKSPISPSIGAPTRSPFATTASPTSILTPWLVGPTSLDLNGTNYFDGHLRCSNRIGSKVTSSVTVELFDYKCINLKNSSNQSSAVAIVNTNPQPSSFFYDVKIIQSNIGDDSGEFVVSTGLSAGAIKFCTRVVTWEGSMQITMRETSFVLSYNLTQNTFNMNNLVIEENNPDSFITEVDSHFSVKACQCSNFACIENPPNIKQNDNLVVCLQPQHFNGLETAVKISNFNSYIVAGSVENGDYVEYNPVWFGSEGWQHDSLTIISEDLNIPGIVMMTTPVIAQFFIQTHTSISVTGNCFLEFDAAKTDDKLSQFTNFRMWFVLKATRQEGCIANLLRRVRNFFK